MVCLSRPYTLKFFEGYIPQNLLSSLLNTLSHMYIQVKFSQVNNIVKLFLNGIRIHFAEGLKWVTLSSSVSGFKIIGLSKFPALSFSSRNIVEGPKLSSSCSEDCQDFRTFNGSAPFPFFFRWRPFFPIF